MSIAIKDARGVFPCPECGSREHSCAHLGSGTSFGPWYCDQCGCGVRGVVTEYGADIEIHSDRKAKTLVLLRLNVDTVQEKPIHIVVEGMVFYPHGGKPAIDQDSNRYFYNEHTCPWNYLRVPVKQGDDTDPHGLFVFQEAVLTPDGYDGHLGDIEEWIELFPSLREGGDL